jgi:colanic acid/amylovoran biosynthesis protein
MLIAMAEACRAAGPDIRCASTADPSRLPDLELVRFVEPAAYRGRRLASRRAWPALVPSWVRRRRNVVISRDLDLILDGSGFAYGDDWGPKKARQSTALFRSTRSRGGKAVLLSQQFGPFSQAGVVAAVREMFEHVDLAFARDETSRRNLEALGISESKLAVSPDFTILVQAVEPRPEELEQLQDAVCFIPNARMLDKTEAAASARYLDWVESLFEFLARRGYPVVIVVHEDKRADWSIVERLNAGRSQQIPVFSPDDARRTKGLVGRSRLVIGSRYHGLVSALVQGVPTIGLGWSHKYVELFSEFDCSRNYLADWTDPKAGQDLVDALYEGPMRDETIRKQREASRRMKAAADDMWRRVWNTVGVGLPTAEDVLVRG